MDTGLWDSCHHEGGFVVKRAEMTEPGLGSFPVVEDLDVVEHRVRKFDSRLPSLAVEQLNLHARPERLHHGVVESASFGVTPDPDVVGKFSEGLPDAQRTLNWVRLASRYPVRIKIIDPPPATFRVGQVAVVVMRPRYRDR